MIVPITAKLAALNDDCRRAIGRTCRLMQTNGIAALPPKDQAAIRRKVKLFSDFTSDNDPYGKREVGAFDHDGQRIFWKIDYYDRTLSAESQNPSDPKQTMRVLTIMLASEY